MDDFFGELRAYLVEQVSVRTPGVKYYWVMNAEWLQDCRQLTTVKGHPLWSPATNVLDPDCLFGMRVVVTEEGGVPHLEIWE